MISRGIPIAQIDSNLEGDPKFLRLRMESPGSYYSALGTYMSIALRAWATARRETDAHLLALMDGGVLDLLHNCQLLDASFSIPESAFEKWPGSVLDTRRKDAERKRGAHVSAGLQRTPPDSNDPSSTLLSSLSSTSPLELAVPSADPLLDALMVALGSAAPSKGAVEWADRLSAEYGEDATIRALGTAAVAGPVKVISRAESALKESVIRRARSDAKRKAAELARAREDRMAAQLAEIGPADPRPLSEILKGLVP